MKRQQRFRWLGTLTALLLAFVQQMMAQDVDDLQEYLDQLATQQTESQAQKGHRKGPEIEVPSGLTEVNLAQFTSYQNRTKTVTVKANVKFTNGIISASSSYSGGTCLLKVYGGATVMLDATAGVDAGAVGAKECLAAVGIYDGSTFYGCGDITGPKEVIEVISFNGGSIEEVGHWPCIAIYINGANDTFNYVSGILKGEISNPNGGTVNGLEGSKEAYAVLSTDQTTLSFYYDGKKGSREGTVYTADQFRTGFDDGWSGINCSNASHIKTVSFDASFADYDGLTSTKYWFNNCSSLQTINGLVNLNTANVTDMSYMFYCCYSLTSLDLSNFNTSNATNMRNMFYYCNGLTVLDINGWNTQNVTNMNDMFANCGSLTELDINGWNTQNVTNMECIFAGCSSLTGLDINGWNTQNVTNMGGIFAGCSSLIGLDINGWNTQNVTNMSGMFTGCSNLTSINLKNFDTENVTDMSGMFRGCNCLTSLDISGWNTQNVLYMSRPQPVILTGGNTTTSEDNGMFLGCSSLVTINVGIGWNTDNVTYSEDMFKGCTSLIGGDGTVFDPNYTDKAKAYAGIGGYLTMEGQEADDLQAFIDANVRTDGVVVVDLSKFQSVIRDVTLNINTGGKYRFVNGTIDRSAMLNDPVVLISNGSTVEVGADAVITGNDHYASTTILMNGGTLYVTQGVVEGGLGVPEYYVGNPCQEPAIQMLSPNDHFFLNNGTIYGPIVCDVDGADIRFEGGGIKAMGLRDPDGNSSPSSSRRRATPSGRRSPYISTHSDVYINATTSEDYTWGNDYVIVLPDGSEEVVSGNNPDAFAIWLYDKSVIHLQKKYEGGFDITLYNKEEGDVVAVGDSYTITQDDVNRITIKVCYTEGPPYTEERDSYLKLEGNKVYLRYYSDSNDDLQDYLNSLEDTKDTMANGTYRREFRNTEWQSLYLPFAIEYNDWAEEFDVARFEGIDIIDNQPVLSATIMESGKARANTSYLIRAKKIGAVLSVNYSTENKVVQSVSYSTDNATYTFTGNYAYLTGMASAQQYRLMGGWLNIPNSDDESLPPFRWYMTINGTQPTEAICGLKVHINHEGDDATAITEEMKSEELRMKKGVAVYDIHGRQIVNSQSSNHKLTRGIYIINNKKYIIN